ncbi:MAG: Gfo/Idh/MocA family oxidoreductase [Clostridia bacterium]|nr:Gfo/Idh/MocA family oxidoreductase [Clostridia bacterium]
MAEKVRLGIIGVGNMGGAHLDNFLEGQLPEIDVTAVADVDPARLEAAKAKCPALHCYDNASALIRSGDVDAVIIATPHYFHPPIGIEALQNGVHVMSEKPAGVYTKQVNELIEVAKHSDKTYAIMFNQRTNCVFRKVRELVQNGGYGEMKRVSWIITDWFRTQQYYDSGAWRATWAGEGGGVMLNQCPHQLDLWQWICGMPSKIRAVCSVGKWHDIEVEDDVTIYAEYPNGATGTFITSTGDCPGTNRLEITLDRAKIICEHNQRTGEHEIWLCELSGSTADYIKTSDKGFGRLESKWVKVSVDGSNPQHIGVMNAFAAHILHGAPLIADGAEGINGLTISNAAFLSSWLNKEVTLPLDEDLYYELLQEKIKNSKYKKNVSAKVEEDMRSTY